MDKICKECQYSNQIGSSSLKVEERIKIAERIKSLGSRNNFPCLKSCYLYVDWLKVNDDDIIRVDQSIEQNLDYREVIFDQ